MYRVGVMISGSATTFEAFCLNVVAEELPIEVPVLVADRARANLQVAERINKLWGWDIEPILLDRETFPGGATERRWDMTDQQSETLLQIAEKHGVDVFSQQGWLSRTRGVFLDEFGLRPEHTSALDGRLLNNHPGIPRDTTGLYGPGVHEVAARLGRSAFTVHGVSDEYDEGFIYRDIEVPVLPGDTADDVARSVQAVEKAFTPQIVLDFLEERAVHGY